MVDFTVAIPTYNGEQRLPDVLQRLRLQVGTDAITWEVLVIDNNSKDGTAVIVQAFQREFPCLLRYCLELQQGAGYARQRAVQLAKSELIGFLDDDNLPDQHWVASAYQFAQQHPQAGAYGSRIVPEYEVEPPAQFKRIQGFLAITDRGAQPRLYETRKKLLPPAAGLVIRKQAWLETVPQQTWLNSLRFKRSDGNDCSEDLEALSYMQQSKWEIWYNPAMNVTHKIPSWRLQRNYLLPLFRSIGLSRHITRMLGTNRWQRPIVFGIYLINDLRKVVTHYIKYRSQLQANLTAACEMQLFVGSLLSPFYLWQRYWQNYWQNYWQK